MLLPGLDRSRWIGLPFTLRSAELSRAVGAPGRSTAELTRIVRSARESCFSGSRRSHRQTRGRRIQPTSLPVRAGSHDLVSILRTTTLREVRLLPMLVAVRSTPCSSTHPRSHFICGGNASGSAHPSWLRARVNASTQACDRRLSTSQHPPDTHRRVQLPQSARPPSRPTERPDTSRSVSPDGGIGPAASPVEGALHAEGRRASRPDLEAQPESPRAQPESPRAQCPGPDSGTVLWRGVAVLGRCCACRWVDEFPCHSG